MKIINLVFILFVKIYQVLKKYFKIPAKCLHYPSCSNYAIMAFKKYNFLTALIKTIMRIRDCHPFSTRPYIDYP